MAITKPPQPRRPGRPLQDDDERNAMRERIAQTAQRLFQEEGYATVSMRRLGKEVGCSPMTLYKYYDGKIAILQTLWAVVLAEVFDQLKVSLEDKSDPQERLYAACLTYVRYWLEHPEHYRLVFMAEGVTQPEVSLFMGNPEITAGFGLLADTIAATASASQGGEGLTKVKVDLTFSTLHGIAHNLITISDYPWSDVEKMVHYFVERLT